MGRLQRQPLALLVDVHGPHPSAGRVDADHLAPHELRAVLAGRLQHEHAELLGAEPAGAARVRNRDGLLGEIGKMPADQARSVMMSAPVSGKSKPRSGDGV